MRFSIIVVALNAGDRLKNTLNSIKEQSFKDYEIVLKDGGSTDGSLDCIESGEFSELNIKKFVQPDTGIYDAMNQGLELSSGEYVYFLNCGDYFYSPDVLEKVNSKIEEFDKNDEDVILYGNILDRRTKDIVNSNPNLNGFGLYRNVPCHQACFYKRKLVLKHPFNIKYKVRADYEQFLWCVYEGLAKLKYMNCTIADYEGDGYSETKNGFRVSKLEHKDIVRKYMKPMDRAKYKTIMVITLQPLRKAIARNPYTSGIYNRIKNKAYESSMGN